ncbi:MAG TPA: leucyl aminopeptidase [Solirubrobacteraceae bacterium]|nr:leucyl aminopeptidase [Solirubrobacteraceae bacterium]
MQVHATTSPPMDVEADTVAVGIYEGKGVPHDVDGGALQPLVDAGEARATPRHLAVAHAAGRRWILVGLGPREGLTAERMREVAAAVHARARELGTRVLCWELPHHVAPEVAGALVEGTLLAAYRFDHYKSSAADAGGGPGELFVSAHDDVGDPVRRAAVVAEAANAARDLQNTPANDLTPQALGRRAAELPGLTVEVGGRERLDELGMGAFAAVARGSDAEPALITLRHEPADARGPLLGFVGKAVTFDTGGISLKPAAKMAAMKFDMSGGAAVVEALGAIARLGLPVRVLGVVGATENMPSGHATRPGDIVRAADGTSIEVNNTDAEGRLVLADCLLHARALGAERLVDVATLTGAIVATFGSVHAGLFGTDDGWCAEIAAAGEATGERVWRLPLGPEYADLIKGRYGDIVNAIAERKALSITAAEFLRRFTGDVPWAHLDIAGVADDRGRPYAAKGGSGWGVRLLAELARRTAG